MKVCPELKKTDELLDTCTQELKIAGLEPSTEKSINLMLMISYAGVMRTLFLGLL